MLKMVFEVCVVASFCGLNLHFLPWPVWLRGLGIVL